MKQDGRRLKQHWRKYFKSEPQTLWQTEIFELKSFLILFSDYIRISLCVLNTINHTV